MWEVESSRLQETLYDDKTQPARKTENFSGSVAGEKGETTGAQSTKNIEYEKRSLSEQSKTNINWNARITRRAGVNSAQSSERKKLESDLAVAIGSNASAVRPKTAFDKFKTRTDARIFLKQSRYQLQQALRRKLNQERVKTYKSSTSIPKGGTIVVENKHRRNDSFLTVTSLQSANTSSIDGESKLLSQYNLNDHIVNNENTINGKIGTISKADKANKTGTTFKTSQYKAATYDARKVRDWMQMPTGKFLSESVSSDSVLKSDSVGDSEISTIPFDRESLCSGPIGTADRIHNKDISISGEPLAFSADDNFSEKEEGNDGENFDREEELNNTQNIATTQDQVTDCSQCVACKIEKIVSSLSVVLANQSLTSKSGDQDSFSEQVRRKIREDMSVPEESVNALEIHIRRLLAARIVDKNSSKEAKQNETKSLKSCDGDEQNEETFKTGKTEETIGVLYAENIFKGTRKQSLSTSPLNISPKENQKAAGTPSSFSKFDGKAKEDIPYRFSYTHFAPSSSIRRVENREQITITGSPQLQAKAAKTKPSDYGISLKIYRNRQNFEKRHKLEETKSTKFILYPRTFNSGSTIVRQYRQDDMPDRLGAWYWDRLEEIEKHRCPPPPNSPVPEEWADM
ncbi:hypothetical protein HOLleu_18925 [Holothuria leucospilota]|uniref:Uncharacterized protein n=1 Tax=Holothuria leucospilota TaxID=206669 RepID=A0A9Q1C4F7_HOLLE|nr:hypothetical protein HOLleu_18925 [Holothuria leucospilota]